MEGLPVTIRLLDPPLHEFLPSAEELAAGTEKAEGGGDCLLHHGKHLRCDEVFGSLLPGIL